MKLENKNIQFLNESEEFFKLIKSSPFQIVGFSVSEELELKLIFRRH